MRTIRPYLALMKKDFGSIAGMSIVLFLLTIVAIMYAVIRHDVLYLLGARYISFIPVLRWFIIGIIYMLTAMFVYSMNVEFFGRTKYTVLSIPIRGSWFLLGKFFVIIIIGFCIYFLRWMLELIPWGTLTKAVLIHVFKCSESILLHGNPDQFLSQFLSLYIPRPSGHIEILFLKILFCIRFALYEIINLTFCLGLASFAQGAICMVKRYRFLLWSGIFLVGIIAFENYRYYFLENFFSNPDQSNEVIRNIFFYSPLVAGSILLAIGLVLFEKYAEV